MPSVNITASGSILEVSSFSKLSFWNEKESVYRNAVVSTQKRCSFVVDCFGVTGKLQEYIQ